MTDRVQFDSLKSSLETAISSAPGSTFPIDRAVEAARRQATARKSGLSVAKGAGEAAMRSLDIADAVAAAAVAGIRQASADPGNAPSELLVDLLAHAESIRALWFDLYLGVKRDTSVAERPLVESSARQLVAQAAACAVHFEGDARQLIEFAREKGL